MAYEVWRGAREDAHFSKIGSPVMGIRPEAEEENEERSVGNSVEMRINLHNAYCVNKILEAGNCRVFI